MPSTSTPSLLLVALALLAGCRESPSPTAPEALRPPEIVGTKAPPGEGPPDRIGPVDGGQQLAPGAVPPLPEDPEACLDEVLRRAGLNRYGDPEGTMYAGGSPLFDEKTGETTPRRVYVEQKRPDLAKLCPPR